MGPEYYALLVRNAFMHIRYTESMTTLDFEHKVQKIIEGIEKSEEISEKNKKLLLDLQRDFTLDGLSYAWQQNLLSRMKVMSTMVDFDFDNASVEDLKELVVKIHKRDISDRTIIDYKKALKRFYKWLNGGEHPEVTDWLKTTDRTKNNTLPEDVLVEKDITVLIDSARTARDKALISLLWETGARIGEVIDLTVDDLRDHKHGYQVVITGKTGSRRLPLISSVPHINNWLSNHPDRHNDNPLWCKIRGGSGAERISYRYILKMLRETKKKAELEKPVNPHHFRHSRATYLASRLKEAQLCQWFGWVQGSEVPSKYVHMSGRDIDSSYARLHGIEDPENPEESKLAPKECPRCESTVPPDGEFCYKCGMALSFEAAQQMEDDEQDIGQKFTEEAQEDPEMLKDMQDFMEMIKVIRSDGELMDDLHKLVKEKKQSR